MSRFAFISLRTHLYFNITKIDRLYWKDCFYNGKIFEEDKVVIKTLRFEKLWSSRRMMKEGVIQSQPSPTYPKELVLMVQSDRRKTDNIAVVQDLTFRGRRVPRPQESLEIERRTSISRSFVYASQMWASILKRTQKSVGTKAEQRLQDDTLRQVSAAQRLLRPFQNDSRSYVSCSMWRPLS